MEHQHEMLHQLLIPTPLSLRQSASVCVERADKKGTTVDRVLTRKCNTISLSPFEPLPLLFLNFCLLHALPFTSKKTPIRRSSYTFTFCLSTLCYSFNFVTLHASLSLSNFTEHVYCYVILLRLKFSRCN